MEPQFKAILTGSDSNIEGTVKPTSSYGLKYAWQFNTTDDTLHLVIARDNNGNWQRIAGSAPYLSGWTDGLALQIIKNN